MSFLAPYMLWGAAAAGIPIALHFFFRSRYRTVPWAAMKFLLTSIEQTSRRLRFQELLLLLVRVAVLVLLALALARPLTTFSGGMGQGDAVDAVFLIDTSYSMGAGDGPVTRLERAKTAALSVIDQLPNHSTVQVITCADRSRLLGPHAPSDLEQAKQIIQELQLSHLASDLLPGLAEAASVLERGQGSNKEFYLFSDMHRPGFDQQAGGVKGTLQAIKDKAAVYLVRCGRSRPKNVAVVGIAPQSGVPRPGERVGFAVLIKNTGSEAVRDLKVSLLVDDDAKSKETQAVQVLGPGETRAVALTGKLEKAGQRVLTAMVEADDLAADNRFDQVILVREQVNILIVDGSPNEREPEKSASYFLEHALLPVADADKAKYYIQIQKVSPRLASPARLAKQDLCLLANVSLRPDARGSAEVLPADFLAELDSFVRQGHGLMIFAGDHVAAEPYNQLLWEKHRLLPAKIKGVRQLPPQKPLYLNRKSAGLPAFLKFKDDYFKSMDLIEVYRTLEIEEPVPAKKARTGDSQDNAKKNKEGVHVVLRYNTGQPAVVTRRVGGGEVMLVATSADPGWKTESPEPTWTNWPLLMYLPFLDVAVGHLLHEQTQNHNLIAGQTLRWFPRDSEAYLYSLAHPDGRMERLGLGEEIGGRRVVTATDLPQAGIYYLLAGKPPRPDAFGSAENEPEADMTLAREKGVPLAVVPDLRESEDLESLNDQQLDERLGFKAIHVLAGSDPGTFSEVERLNREWTLWILALVLALFLGEAVLAWWCGKAW